MCIEDYLYYQRRYNKIATRWFKESNNEELEDVLKNLTRVLFRFRSNFKDDESHKHFYRFLDNYPRSVVNSFLTNGQLESKKWLVEVLADELNVRELGIVHIMGGWYGLLAYFLLHSDNFKIGRIRNFDKDESVLDIADLLNKKWVANNWHYKTVITDIFELDYSTTKYNVMNVEGESIPLEDKSDTIINTSCEHIDFKKWISLIPKNKLVILQSNDFFGEEGHINCHSSLEEFANEASLTEVMFKGEKELERYSRYMIIGRK